MCDLTHSYVWHDSFICVIHSYVWHASFCCSWAFCDRSFWIVWYRCDTFIFVVWLLVLCLYWIRVTDSCMKHDSFFWVDGVLWPVLTSHVWWMDNVMCAIDAYVQGSLRKRATNYRALSAKCVRYMHDIIAHMTLCTYHTWNTDEWIAQYTHIAHMTLSIWYVWQIHMCAIHAYVLRDSFIGVSYVWYVHVGAWLIHLCFICMTYSCMEHDPSICCSHVRHIRICHITPSCVACCSRSHVRCCVLCYFHTPLSSLNHRMYVCMLVYVCV